MLLLVLAYYYDKLEQVSLSYYESKIESKIHTYEKEIIDIFQDEEFIKRAIVFDFEESELDELRQLSRNNYSIFIYQKPDSLVFWTSNKILPFDSEVEFSDEPISRFSTIKKGGYAVLNYPYHSDSQQYALVGLIPITQQYSIQNEYLKNGISIVDDLPDEISLNFEPNEYGIENLNGETLFYLSENKKDYLDKHQQFIVLLLYLSGLLILFSFLNSLSLQLIEFFPSWISVAFIISAVFLVRLGTNFLGFDEKFSDLDIFDTNYFSRTVIPIGNLLINILINLWLMVFVHRHFTLPDYFLHKKKWHQYFIVGAFVLIFTAIFATTETFRRIILNAGESFDINTLYTLKTAPITGTISCALILLTLFLFINKIKKLIEPLEHFSTTVRVFILGIFGVVFLGLYGLKIFDFALLISGVWGIFTIIITHYFIRQKHPGFLWLVGWICTFGLYSSVLFNLFNNAKEIQNRIFYAENLALERDIYMEQKFNDVALSIAEDRFIKKLSDLFIPRNRIIDQIEGQYLKDYFGNDYEYKVHFYNSDTTRTKGEQLDFSYFAELLADSKSTSNSFLFYWNNSKGEQKYIADIPIRGDNQKLYKIVILFEPKTIVKLSDYPDLLLDKTAEIQVKAEDYDYAIYESGIKIKDKGKNFPEQFNFPLSGKQNNVIERNNKSYLIHQTSDKRIIVIEKELEDWGQKFSLFSYTFCLYLVLFVLLSIVNRIVSMSLSTDSQISRRQSSLRNKIQNNVILIIIIGFIGIGVTTVVYFRAEADDYHAVRLSRKAQSVQESVNYEMRQANNSFFLPDVEVLDKIHKLNVNIYNPDGSIFNSSQQDIFTKNLLSFQIDPVAFHAITNLNRSIVYRTEKIGKLEYSAAYFPVLKNEQIVAIIGLPYYTEKENSRKDIGSFMGRLLNVYVIIFIFAGILTSYLTGQITNPLFKLSNQMQGVKLGQKNEKLNWEVQDEIGVLIDEYNKMLVELERSANLLAKSEREGAWREMAKQVAHEIKNPLTPMKLQIQFLQHAYKNRPEEIGPLLKRTADTLIEQIDGLTRIASDFSNFAKMPTANNEYLNLNDIVKSVYQLFSNEAQIKLSIAIPEEICTIFADKDQVIRVLNNVIKNAIQAIKFAVDFDKEGQVEIVLERQSDSTVIRVKDNGSGIAESEVNKIFTPNFTTKNSGTGIGLAMSKNIVEAAGGRIYFESTVNIGTTFFIEFPIAEMPN